MAGNKKLSGGERSGYNLFYSRFSRNSTVDGWTPIYPHLNVINVNGLVEVGSCVCPLTAHPHTTLGLADYSLFIQTHAGYFVVFRVEGDPT